MFAHERHAGDDKVQAYSDLNLKLDLSLFEALANEERPKASTCRGDWNAKLGASHVSISAHAKLEAAWPEGNEELCGSLTSGWT